MMLTRTDPFGSLRSLDRAFDELVSSTLRPVRARRPVPFAFDAAWKDGDLVLTVDLPGVPTDAISVDVAEHTLTVSVERSTDQGTTTEQRSLRLGSALDPSGVEARHEYGRLTITVPAIKAPEPRAVRIEIATPSKDEPAMIETEATEAEAATAETGQEPGTATS